MRIQTLLTGLGAILLVGTCHAAGVPIEPGQWEMKSTVTMSMMPQPTVSTNLECIEEDVLDPEDFNVDEDNPCEFTELTIDGNSASWLINCPLDSGQEMNGQWNVTSHGDSLSGTGSMTMEFSGQKMSFDMVWEGRRLGDCE